MGSNPTVGTIFQSHRDFNLKGENMKVLVMWEFDVDVEDFDPKCIDIPGLAKDLTKQELASQIINGDLTVDDFEYSVVI